jgi:hypothetical protein
MATNSGLQHFNKGFEKMFAGKLTLRSPGLKAALIGAVALSALSGTSAQAATQGSLAATSTGSIGISATVPARARITGLADVAFAPTDLTVAVSNNQDVCVWSNTSTKGYNVTATGSGASSAFTLTTGGASPLLVPYTVAWNPSAGQTSGTALTASMVSGNQVSTATNQTCSGGETQSLILGIVASELGGMQATTSYTGTLTLVVAPV